MKPIKFKPSKHTPKVVLDNEKGVIEFVGKSRPEDAMLFFGDIHTWLDNYIENPLDNTYVKFQLEYFNSASAKHIKHVLTLLKKIEEKGKTIVIDWYYLEDDEDMKEQGEEYESLIELPFNLKAY